jgi:hypothetical protein
MLRSTGVASVLSRVSPLEVHTTLSFVDRHADIRPVSLGDTPPCNVERTIACDRGRDTVKWMTGGRIGLAAMYLVALVGCASKIGPTGTPAADGTGDVTSAAAGNGTGVMSTGGTGVSGTAASGAADRSAGAGEGGGRAGASGPGASAAAGVGDLGSGGRASGGSAGTTGSGIAGSGMASGGMAGSGMAASGMGSGGTGAQPASPIRHVFVIAMENHDAGSIIGNSANASYINGELLVKYASASSFIDRLQISIVSEPHYVWMEAGTNAFSDHTFSSDDDPSASNSTASKEHLATQLTSKGLTFMAYQEGIDGTTGACPIQASGYYQPKHDPFVFFRDVSGNPPSKSNAACVAHHKDLSKLAGDLQNNAVASYNFITPNQCNDMHGQSGCPNSNTVQAGDDWLRKNLPPLISFCDANDGVIFIVWDEGESTQKIPFLAVGARVKSHYVGTVEYDHSSLVRSVERIFGLPVLSKVSAANDFGDLFQAGQFP